VTIRDVRRGSRILQRRVSNPSERGTGGRAPKGVGSRKGAVPLPRKFLYFLYHNGELKRHVLNTYCLFSKKGTIIKRTGVRTPWNPLDPPLEVPYALEELAESRVTDE